MSFTSALSAWFCVDSSKDRMRRDSKRWKIRRWSVLVSLWFQLCLTNFPSTFHLSPLLSMPPCVLWIFVLFSWCETSKYLMESFKCANKMQIRRLILPRQGSFQVIERIFPPHPRGVACSKLCFREIYQETLWRKEVEESNWGNWLKNHGCSLDKLKVLLVWIRVVFRRREETGTKTLNLMYVKYILHSSPPHSNLICKSNCAWISRATSSQRLEMLTHLVTPSDDYTLSHSHC